MVGQELFNLEKFTYFNDKLRDAAHLLMRRRQYFVGEKVNKGLIYLQCITAGITAATELDLTGVAVDDELSDGEARWKVLSITGVPTGAGGGMSLKDWKPNTTYEADNVFVYENEIYKALVKHISSSAFIELPILEEYTPVDWQPNTLYNVGDIFIESDILYEVLTSFTSGATFSVTSDIDVYTPKTFAVGVDVYIDDIVLYNSVYYKALYDFVCGDTFSLYAFEKYVPHELTEEEIRDIIRNFTPEYHAIYASSGNPVGTILTFMGTIPPTDYLACDGIIYNIDDYPLLAEHIKIQFGRYDYFGGDGTTTFAVPDLRGEFLRGTGTNSHTNQGSGDSVGVHQDGTEFPNVFWNTLNRLQIDVTLKGMSGNVDNILPRYFSSETIFTNTWDEGGTSLVGSYTSRPTNTSVLYCIKYK